MKITRILILVALLSLVFPVSAYAASHQANLPRPLQQDDAPTQTPEAAEPTQTPEDQETTQTAEPDAFDSIEEVLGTLGVFAAFMLILAVGAEVTIDSLKVIAGFKSKPTALDSVNKLKEWLPGSLEEMGASESSVSQLKLTLDTMAGHMKEVDKATEAIKTIDQWLPDYLKNLSVDKINDLLTNNLPDLKDALKKQVGQENAGVALGWLRGALATLKVTSVKDLASQARTLLQEVDKFKDDQKVADAIDAALQKVLPSSLSDLTQGSQKLLQEYLPQVTEELKQHGIDPKINPAYQKVLDQVGTWLSGTLTYLEANNSSAYTAAMTTLLQAVEDRRDNIHSWIGKGVRKIVRCLKSKLGLEPNPMDPPVTAFIKKWLKRLLEGIDRFRTGDHFIPPLNPANLAKVLLERDSQHNEEELSRLRWLRLVSVLIGVALAVMLKVDVGELLKPIISAELYKVLTNPLCEVLAANAWCSGIIANPQIKNFLGTATIGMLLSGLAASAGSAFWHDMLDRLQVAKKTTSEIKDLVAQIKQLEQGK
ncbi:MAG: hypothetical protein JW726_05145 [Anaerolineales bacterium]|nr:hypothetical protein [Anaerolineales bacterium]